MDGEECRCEMQLESSEKALRHVNLGKCQNRYMRCGPKEQPLKLNTLDEGFGFLSKPSFIVSQASQVPLLRGFFLDMEASSLPLQVRAHDS